MSVIRETRNLWDCLASLRITGPGRAHLSTGACISANFSAMSGRPALLWHVPGTICLRGSRFDSPFLEGEPTRGLPHDRMSRPDSILPLALVSWEAAGLCGSTGGDGERRR
jgi:hypothetical protein